MIVARGFKFRICPTPEQEALFGQFAGVVRLIYNLGLEQRRDFHRQYRRAMGRSIGVVSQCKELTALRAEVEWIAAVPQSCENAALRDLDRAFANFFSGRAGYPQPRCKGRDETFRFLGREISARRINAKWSEVRLPKIGWVKYRCSRDVRGRVLNATIGQDLNGWNIAFTCEIELEAIEPLPGMVGIDRGVASTLTLSTGEMMRLPASLDRLEARTRKAQRVLSRRATGSKRRASQRRLVARLQARMARIRRDFHHRVSRCISDRFGTVVLEDLRVADMTRSAAGTVAAPGLKVKQKSGLNRAILNSGWGQLAALLDYKTAERGGLIIMVPAQYTSQTCAACGKVDAGSRKSQARFECTSCDYVDNADVNAAIEIARRGSTPLLRVEARAQARPMKREPAGRAPHEPRAARL